MLMCCCVVGVGFCVGCCGGSLLVAVLVFLLGAVVGIRCDLFCWRGVCCNVGVACSSCVVGVVLVTGTVVPGVDIGSAVFGLVFVSQSLIRCSEYL